MALFTGDFKSKELKKSTPITVILPSDNINYLEGIDSSAKPPFKTLYLLHGMFGNNETFVYNTLIRSFATDNNLAVVMPSCDNSFYLNNPPAYEYYSNYVGEELVNFTREIFPLSTKREDTFIAGFSMGGYGAIRTGLLYNDTFSAIGGISSALISHRLKYVVDEFKEVVDTKEYLESVFGDLSKVVGSDKDPEFLIDELLEKNKEIPKIFMTVGKNDFLRTENEAFHKFLVEKNVPVTFNEYPGEHTWDFCNTHIEQFIKWLEL
ncbi:MAG: alpha/beta hydrolase-fold protein [Methanobrevibacter sp.]|uniref:alpha/beta hydrolase n=1 Tax=Methanobrevibacter sp. TaxID=66852 RepID=UPI0026E0E77B|nr:alpha/beta hydrolase-fold protein [Methanobrevibacter sp.]MDO5849181.1 alpha/beta hydrolase-fold protein [Methanobrevibacter sp.]